MGMSDCEHCEGGWVPVAPAYAERQHPWPAPDPAVSEKVHAERCEIVRYRRMVAARAVFPCRECRPELFLLWAGGHLGPRHDRTGCPTCRELAGHPAPRRSRERESAPTAPPPRRDLDF